MFFLDINCCATIKHRCVTHLYCCNSIQQREAFMHKFILRIVPNFALKYRQPVTGHRQLSTPFYRFIYQTALKSFLQQKALRFFHFYENIFFAF